MNESRYSSTVLGKKVGGEAIKYLHFLGGQYYLIFSLTEFVSVSRKHFQL